MSRPSLLFFAVTLAPAAQEVPKFEVASLRQASDTAAALDPGKRGAGGGCRESFRVDRAQVHIQCASLIALVAYAWRVPPDRVKGPDWMMAVRAPRFDLTAKMPEDAAPAAVPEMVRALLAERFEMSARRGPATLSRSREADSK